MSLKTFGSDWLTETSLSVEMFDDAMERRSRETEVDVTEVKPFYPNPGTQSELFFDLLGFQRGKTPKPVIYPQGQVEAIKAILEKEDHILKHPEVLQPKLEAYPVDFSKGCAPKYPNILYRAGSRGGKTWGGAGFITDMALSNPGAEFLISANSYPQLRDSTITTLIKHLLSRDVPFEPWRGSIPATANSIAHSKLMVINGCTIYCRSAADFIGGGASSQSILGLGFLAAWLDEWLKIQDVEPFNILTTRMSQPGIEPICLVTSTIDPHNPYGWGYDLFDSDERSPELKKQFVSLTSSTVENRHNISETYIQRQHAQMTRELFKIHVLGEYAVTTEGKAYDYFDRTRHVKEISQDNGWTQMIMVDFNRSPASATLGQFKGNTIQVYFEWYLINSNTFKLAAAIAQELIRRNIRYVAVFGDATGSIPTANSVHTNWQIIFEALSNAGIQARNGVPKSNPAVVDRVNGVNLAFKNDELFIGSNCRELIKDWESMQWRNNKDLDKRDQKRSHLSDGVGYGVWAINPMQRRLLAGNGNYGL